METRDLICPYCGKSFSTKHKQKIYCSRACYYEQAKIRNAKWFENHKNARKNDSYVYKPSGKCKICGEIVYNSMLFVRRSSKKIHDECAIREAKEILKSGKNLNNIQYQRIVTRGYTVGELRQEIMEEANMSEYFEKDELSDKEIECYEVWGTYGNCHKSCKYWSECDEKNKYPPA